MPGVRLTRVCLRSLALWRRVCPVCCSCSQIMGRAETDDLSAAQIFYPCMQVSARLSPLLPVLALSPGCLPAA